MLRFMMGLAIFAVIAAFLGFANPGLRWGGLARDLFVFYVGLLGLCALASLFSRRKRPSPGDQASRKL